MVAYKLHYFANVGGRAELIRLLLAYGELPYEEVAIPMEEWPVHKPNYPNGKVPVMEIDGKILTQSIAIARYVAKKLDLLGRDDWEAAQADAFIALIEDIIVALKEKGIGGTANMTSEMVALAVESLKPFMARLEKHLKSTNGVNLVGDRLTWADIGLADMLKRCSKAAPMLFDEFPAVKTFADAIYELPGIKERVAERKIVF